MDWFRCMHWHTCTSGNCGSRQPNGVVANVKGCYMTLMGMPVVSQGGSYTIAPPPSQNRDFVHRGSGCGMANYRHKSCPPFSP